jgi:hypothetical protein
MYKFITTYRRYIIGIALGAIAGFLYWRFVGCTSGSCPLTSQWHTTTLYGAVMGYLLSSPSKGKKVKEENTNSTV